MRMRYGFGLAVLLASAALAHAEPATALDIGYRQMYNLRFAEAHDTFHQWRASHPADPMGPVSDAAAYLFSEFDRLHILEAELFTDDEAFRHRQRPNADPALKQAFENDLAEGERLANALLARNPQDEDAMFAKILDYGLRCDYLALIEKRYIASLNYTKASRTLAEQLLAKDPTRYDAYLAIGVENYLLGINPAPVRWVLRITGSQTDKAEGIQKLRLAAEKGHYLKPFARLMLAVAALRDKDRSSARQLLAGLAREFPQNQLYAKELARLN